MLKKGESNVSRLLHRFQCDLKQSLTHELAVWLTTCISNVQYIEKPHTSNEKQLILVIVESEQICFCLRHAKLISDYQFV